MTLWIVFGLMLLVAALSAVWPIYRHQQRLSVSAALVVVGIVALSVFVYSEIGRPNASSEPTVADSIDEMVASLDARLRENPDDLVGWKMLARSYMELGNVPKAIVAYEKAMALEASGNADTLVSLGEAVLIHDRSAINGRAGELFETAISLEPGNPRALFFGGLAAAQRGQALLAADRWETLLAIGAPPEIEETLRQRVAEWRGEQKPPANLSVATTSETAIVVSIDIKMSDAAADAVNPASTVFIIARDPARPAPPLAVARRKAGELPAVVDLSDSDAMVPGRVPSAYEQLEIIVRVSGSGQPIAQSGDWFGQGLIRPEQGRKIVLTIDQQVP